MSANPRHRSSKVYDGPDRMSHRSPLNGTGVSNEDLKKPLIAIANSFTEINPGHVHLDRLVEHVKLGVAAAGGVPREFNTIAVCDGIVMGHQGMKMSLPSREVIADSVEIMAESHGFDAMICVTTCDKIDPGMLMAAARINIPTIFVLGGPMEPGCPTWAWAGASRSTVSPTRACCARPAIRTCSFSRPPETREARWGRRFSYGTNIWTPRARPTAGATA